MRKLFCCLLFLLGKQVFASDTLQVGMSSALLKSGDTLDFKCVIPDFESLKLHTATLNVWIEDVQRTKRWKFRYPILNGEVGASLAISDKIPDGRYAVNFLVQRGFFKIMGNVLDHEKRDSNLTYMMISKSQKSSYLDIAHVNPDGSFRLKSTLFADSAYFIFSPPRKVRNNYLTIDIETPLDSMFTPVLSKTFFLTVGDPKMLMKKYTDTSAYHFTTTAPPDPSFLPNVTVTGKYKSKVQQYDEEYSRGLFQRNDVIVFDGIESEEIARSVSVLRFLETRVPGLTVVMNPSGQEVAKWRNEPVEVYIDEFKMEAGDYNIVSPFEIAMIKVYRPPAQLSSFSGGAGAVAIYTKKGKYAVNTRNRHNFIVKGYTKIESVWE